MQINKNQIQEAIQAEIDKGVSQRQLARRIGVSDATISKINNGIHEDISEQMWRKLAMYFGIDTWNVVKTANFATIHALCEDAQARHRMRVVSGPTGAGKTTALQKYTRRPDVTNAFYVLAKSSMNEKELVRAIARAIGVQAETTTYGFLEMIEEQCKRIINPLIIIDDAGKLKDRKLLLIQQIRDMTEVNCGIVLASVDYLYDNLHKGARRNRVGFPELLSRLGRFQTLNQPTRQEVAAICKANGIDDAQVASYIYSRSEEYRQVYDAIMDLRHYSTSRNQAITVDLAQQVL